MATTAPRRPTPPTASLLRLFLSLATESKAIAKQAARPATRLDSVFRCRTCGRQFATFQALGGHRTSHNRLRVRADGLDLLLGARPGKGTARDDVHRCNTCGAVFHTGQALGGHMRRHRAPASTAVTRSVALSSEDEDGREDDNDDHLPTVTFIKFM